MTFGVLLSVFALALFGGFHCAAMCGGIAVAVETRGRAEDAGAPAAAASAASAGSGDTVDPIPIAFWRSRSQWLRSQLILHAGRVATYCLLGAVLGAAGAAAWKADVLPLQRWLYGAGSAMLAAVGVALACRREGMGAARWVEGLMARVTLVAGRRTRRRLPLAGAGGGRGGAFRRFATGMAWGLVPCAMVYSALGLALLAGNAQSGALVMAAFGLGTLPNLLMLSGISGHLRRWTRRPAARLAVGAGIAAFGAAGVARAVALPESLAAHGFCLVF